MVMEATIGGPREALDPPYGHEKACQPDYTVV